MKLYIVPTPIGNLKDITLRALEVLKSVNYIVCEDTRRTKMLLDHYGIKDKKLISYFAPRENEKIPKILEILEKEDIALVVDAGMPGISDPGHKLIRACLEKTRISCPNEETNNSYKIRANNAGKIRVNQSHIEIEVLPGPAAFLTALVGSGLPTDKFIFLGFLPKKGLENYLQKYKDFEATIIFYESPQRILKTLDVIEKIFGDVDIVIAREISKIYEEYIRGKLKEVKEKLKNRKLKGEITVTFRS